MSNSRVLNTHRPGLFSPKIRGSVSNLDLARASVSKRTFAEFKNTNIASTSSFRYGDKPGLISTQQIPIDYSQFENHTFFHSAVAKVNEAFDKIINFYPFDGNNKEIEDYEDSLTGFEKYVLDSFPKSTGYLVLSGTQKNEVGSNGNYISIIDHVGSEYSSIASAKTGQTLLNPNKSPFTFEFFIKVPEIINDNQVLIQKISGSNSISKNMTLALSSSTSTEKCDLIFGVTSGSNFLYASCPIKKGKFLHINASYDKEGDQKLHIRRDLVNEYTSSTAVEFETLTFPAGNLNIASGSSVRMNNSPLLFIPQQTFSGSLDEFRYFKSFRSYEKIKKYMYNSLDFNKSDVDEKLTVYFKFNEPSGSYSGNSVILDSSGNSLTTDLKNFILYNRLTGSDNPVGNESANRNPVLFPSFDKTITLNNTLMTTASLYDDFNPNLITKLVPVHYFSEGNQQEDFNQILGTFENTTLKGGKFPGTSQLRSSQRLTIFLLVWAKFFDELKIFTDSFSNLKNASYDDYEVIPDALLAKAGEIQGIKLPALFRGSNIKQLFDGVDLEKDPVGSQLPLIKIQNIIWKRILASMPYIRKTKGTLNSVKSVFKSSGIDPDNIFLIREYGGSSERRIDRVKEQKRDVIRVLPFSSSFCKEVQTIDHQGRPNKKPTIKSGYLSGSRIETGTPNIDMSTASVSIVASNAPVVGQTLTLRTADGSSATFACHGSSTSATLFSRLGTKHGLDNLKAAIEASSIASKVSVSSVAGTDPYNITITQNIGGVEGNTTVTSACEFYSIGGASAPGDGVFSGGKGFTNKLQYPPHGISNNPSDGLFTSSSFTFEGQYRFHHRDTHYTTQSLVRLHTTGTSNTSQYESVLTNLIYNSGSSELTLFVIDSPSSGFVTPYKNTSLKLSGVKLFDSDLWNISFSVNSGEKTGNVQTGSLFLRAGKASAGKIEEYYATSSYYDRPLRASAPTSLFSNITSSLNTSGAFISIGSQSLGGSGLGMFVNDKNLDPFYRTTEFSGELGGIRFWSKDTTLDEWKSHVRNPLSYGLNDPLKNYLFEETVSGSFEKLRLLTSTKQSTTASDSFRNFTYFDFTQNEKHLEGTGFEPNKNPVVKPEYVIFNTITPYFDLSIADEKVRVRSLSDVSRIDEHPYAQTTPVYEVMPSEKTLDDPRFAIEMSSMKGINDDIVRIFSDYDFLDTALGKTNLLFGDRYPELDQLRKLYFNNILDELNIGKYRELFKWIDNSFTDIVGNLLPHTTKFMGINFIYENHMLERNNFKYLFDEIYLKAKPLTSDRTLLLSQFVAILRRM